MVLQVLGADRRPMGGGWEILGPGRAVDRGSPTRKKIENGTCFGQMYTARGAGSSDVKRRGVCVNRAGRQGGVLRGGRGGKDPAPLQKLAKCVRRTGGLQPDRCQKITPPTPRRVDRRLCDGPDVGHVTPGPRGVGTSWDRFRVALREQFDTRTHLLAGHFRGRFAKTSAGGTGGPAGPGSGHDAAAGGWLGVISREMHPGANTTTTTRGGRAVFTARPQPGPRGCGRRQRTYRGAGPVIEDHAAAGGSAGFPGKVCGSAGAPRVLQILGADRRRWGRGQENRAGSVEHRRARPVSWQNKDMRQTSVHVSAARGSRAFPRNVCGCLSRATNGSGPARRPGWSSRITPAGNWSTPQTRAAVRSTAPG